jgi:glucokinase
MSFLPTGGIYITGGLAPKHYLSWIQGENSCFMKAYRDKGRASSVLDDIPLFLVLCEDMGLRGAVRFAKEMATRISFT